MLGTREASCCLYSLRHVQDIVLLGARAKRRVACEFVARVRRRADGGIRGEYVMCNSPASTILVSMVG